MVHGSWSNKTHALVIVKNSFAGPHAQFLSSHPSFITNFTSELHNGHFNHCGYALCQLQLELQPLELGNLPHNLYTRIRYPLATMSGSNLQSSLSTGVARNLKQNEDARDHDSEMKIHGASHDDLRVHFAKWLESHVTEILENKEGEEICPPHPRYNRFLIVDEGVLRDFKTSPSLSPYSKDFKESPYLKAVKASHNDADEDRLAPRYSGRNNVREDLSLPGSTRIPLIFLRDF
ncbi:uncharacterized protein M437DRAFT_66592 [Aureobasidium melanogenum CBS 110374]|uniref:Uncharacterized protein n=1 Tax=Aureobasidium melanogenum (strain CBS 110374) TaxID=1043003 RepID=A0A074VSF5_AURM1|nr:uncharacterized protein M437DRAFT_66592 [Aureobasidium melanogenum CBS 110374]KEQ62154.1 hypothetical protein M437DRAFT_66592 [Aureobasidium melanogenum CBS 110374]